MRRYERVTRRLPSRGFNVPRLMSMILMLLVLFMLINRARDPSVWRWLARDPGDGAGPSVAIEEDEAPQAAKLEAQPAEPGAQPPAGPLGATGPTDEDPEEAEFMKEAFQAVTDMTLENTSVEMPAYQRLVQWSLNQPFALMNRRARRNVLYMQLIHDPDEYRGKLVRIDLMVRRILTWDLKVYENDGPSREKNAKPTKVIPVYEAWGNSRQSGEHFYNLILVAPPAGMPVGDALELQARFVGYFFKVQRYIDAKQRANRAPVLIGRLDWEPTRAVAFRETDRYVTYGVGIAVVLIIALTLGWVVWARRRPASSLLVTGSRPAQIAVEQWFDRAEAGALEDDLDLESDQDRTPGKPGLGGQEKGNGDAVSRRLDVDRPPGE